MWFSESSAKEAQVSKGGLLSKNQGPEVTRLQLEEFLSSAVIGVKMFQWLFETFVHVLRRSTLMETLHTSFLGLGKAPV